MKNEEIEENSLDEEIEFNPYKCDMYSFGKVLKKMLGKDQAKNIKDPLLKQIIDKLTAKNYKERIDAKIANLKAACAKLTEEQKKSARAKVYFNSIYKFDLLK